MLHRTWPRLLAALLLAVASLLAAAPVGALGSTVSPDIGPPGTRFSFTAPGFAPNELVRVAVKTPEGRVVRFADGGGIDIPVFADGAGTASWAFNVPAATPDGLYLAEAVNVGAQVRQRIAFIVQAGTQARDLAPPTPGVDVLVRPAIGPPGTLFAFRATGFTPIERIGIWLHSPDGSISDLTIDLSGNATHFADSTGAVQWVVSTKAATLDGRYVAVAAGVTSGVTRVAAFTVQRGAVQPSPIQTPNAFVTPQIGPPGTSFAFTATGLMPGEGVGIWIHRPDGTISTVTADGKAVKADGMGIALWSVTAGSGLGDGVYAMVAQGLVSTQVRVVRFEIRR